MEFGIVVVPAAPMRRKPRHQREMVSQLLFGEAIKVIRKKNDLWVKVISLHDGYEGWMTTTQLKEVGAREVLTRPSYATRELFSTIRINDQLMHIPAGSSLPAFQHGNGMIGDILYTYSGTPENIAQLSPREELLRGLVIPWLNAPYVWGGRTILGVDCSGFVQVNYKMMGIDLPRDAWQQAQEGQPVKKLKEAKPGDLVFFDDKDEIVHVGILLGSDQVIHASGKVRIDTIDKKGIISSTTDARTHQLKAIRSYW